jgi:hemoglobin
MLFIHAGMGADDDLGDRFVECFVKAVDDADLPVDPDFRRSLRADMEWAVRDVHVYNPRGSTVQANLPVPHWAWDWNLNSSLSEIVWSRTATNLLIGRPA